MAKNIYVCLECREVEVCIGLPSMGNCKKGGHHRWRNLGEPGNQRYHCKKCGIIVHVKSQPNSFTCPAAMQHDWEII